MLPSRKHHRTKHQDRQGCDWKLSNLLLTITATGLYNVIDDMVLYSFLIRDRKLGGESNALERELRLFTKCQRGIHMLKRFVIFICLLLFIVGSIAFGCEVAARSGSVDGHWHHNWTIAPWINYWESTVMSASASLKSDTNGHTLSSTMTVKRGSYTYIDNEVRSSWSSTVPNATLTGDMQNKTGGFCSQKDCNVAARTFWDKNWSFDNADPRNATPGEIQ